MLRRDFQLSRKERLRRTLYKTLRDELDYSLIQFGIIDGYEKIKKTGQEYAFVSMRELKPRGKVDSVENELIEGFIILFAEDVIPSNLKKYIRYFDNNRVVKENLPEVVLKYGKIAPELLKIQKNFEHSKFYGLIKSLLPVDYAILIQQDGSSKNHIRYALSHFHVRIDWLIDFAAESLGKRLRYISKDLYEKGEKVASDMVEKLFEYYSFHHTVSGRRTAAVVACELLSSTGFLNTVYVNSAESRTLTKMSEDAISKYCLVKITTKHIAKLEKNDKFKMKDFRRNYIIDDTKDGGVALFRVVYTRSEYSEPPTDGKLRELLPDVNFLKVAHQEILPKPKAVDKAPIPYSIIYDQQDPFAV